MKFPKLLIPFLAVVLPTVHFGHNEIKDNTIVPRIRIKNEEEITSDESDSQGIILRQFSDSERFLRFVKHSSHSSHRSHSSHKSHTSHQSGKHNSHTSHYSGSGSADCNGCEFDAPTDEIEKVSFDINKLVVNK